MVCSSFNAPLLDYAPYSPHSFCPTPHQMQTAGVCSVIGVVVLGAMLYVLTTPVAIPRMPVRMPTGMMGAATAFRSTLQDSFAAPKEEEPFRSIVSEPDLDEGVLRPVREMPIYRQAPLAEYFSD